MDFTGKTVIVTGSAVGIGRDAAIAFSNLGANVVVNYSASKSDAEKTQQMATAAGGNAIVCQADVSREDDAKRLVAETTAAFGGVDVLVNNAGITSFISFPDLDKADADTWRRLYEVNVMGMFFCCREAAKAMGEKGGAIVNLASIAGHRANASSIPYAVTKAAILHLTRCLAATLGPKIRVNSVSPGVIDDTRWNSGRTDVNIDDMYAKSAEMSLLKRVGHSGDIASAILFLSSEESSFCSGVDLLVDGGRHLVV